MEEKQIAAGLTELKPVAGMYGSEPSANPQPTSGRDWKTLVTKCGKVALITTSISVVLVVCISFGVYYAVQNQRRDFLIRSRIEQFRADANCKDVKGGVSCVVCNNSITLGKESLHGFPWYSYYDNDTHYMESLYKMPFSKAVSSCHKLGMVILEIQTPEEYNYLRDTFIVSDSDWYYWLGASSEGRVSPLDFRYIQSGQRLSWTKWAQGQPRKDQARRCIRMNGGDGSWSTEQCPAANGALCECEHQNPPDPPIDVRIKP